MAEEKLVIYPTTLNRMNCRLHYYWSRRYKAPGSPAQSLGLAIHDALQAYYEDGTDLVKAYKRWIQDHPDESAYFDVPLGEAMMRNYRRKYADERFEVLAAELEIARRIPVPKDEPDPPERANKFYVGARVDLIVRDLSVDKIFVVDHKTFDRFYADSIQRDHQFVIETYVSRGWLKDEPVDGFLYNGLRKKAKPGRTTNLFERIPLDVNKRMVSTMLHRAYWTLKEATAENYPIFPEPSSLVCAYCKFKSACTEYMRGGDYKFILNNTMSRREDDDDTFWIEEAYEE